MKIQMLSILLAYEIKLKNSIMLFALSVYKIHRIMLHALKLPDQYWKFKTIPHREFSKEDKLLIRLYYQHSHNAVYIAVYKTHFLFYPYTHMSIPNRRCTTKIRSQNSLLALWNHAGLGWKGLLKIPGQNYCSKQAILIKVYGVFPEV